MSAVPHMSGFIFRFAVFLSLQFPPPQVKFYLSKDKYTNIVCGHESSVFPVLPQVDAHMSSHDQDYSSETDMFNHRNSIWDISYHV